MRENALTFVVYFLLLGQKALIRPFTTP